MLEATKASQIITALHDQEVILSMPKFNISTSSFSMMDVLEGLGMTDAFKPQIADFDGIADTHELYIGDVIHKATITVDEQGTEAAAASAVSMMAGAAPPSVKPVEMHIDHPFVFLIRDLHTGTILFMGRVANPQP
ncbi:MAG: hypothetical protein H0X37_00755 [Herpetosiphonaceae bacterium]|nr:hypothetical protein [Herpetosiphonaceae bacterium]